MKKKYKLEELGCANCAQRMEDAINKIDGVNNACINFMTSKLILDADEEKLDEILAQSQKEIGKIERNCKIVF